MSGRKRMPASGSAKSKGSASGTRERWSSSQHQDSRLGSQRNGSKEARSRGEHAVATSGEGEMSPGEPRPPKDSSRSKGYTNSSERDHGYMRRALACAQNESLRDGQQAPTTTTGAASGGEQRRNRYFDDPAPGQGGKPASVTLVPQSTRECIQREKEMSDAGEDLKEWNERKTRAREQRGEDQRESMRMLQDYSPWGKPGSGAPNGSRTEKSQALQESRQQLTSDGDSHLSQMSLQMGSSRGGGGDVPRTNSGRRVTRLRAHPETRFQDHMSRSPFGVPTRRGVCDSPPTTSPRFCKSTNTLQPLEEHDEAFFQFGKPGCGAPLKTNSGSVKTALTNPSLDEAQRLHMEQRRREAARYRQQLDEQAGEKKDKLPQRVRQASSEPYDPWGKGIGNVPRDSAGFNRVPPKLRNPLDTALVSDKGSSVADALVREGSGGPRNHPADQMLSDQEHHVYLESIRDSTERRRPADHHCPENVRSTADWMDGLQVGRPRRDPVTDKLLPADRKGLRDLYANGSEAALSPRRVRDSEKYELHCHLTEQAEQRQRRREESRVREREEVEMHMDALDGMFGRPGNGAPIRDDKGHVQAGRMKSNEISLESYKADTTAVRL